MLSLLLTRGVDGTKLTCGVDVGGLRPAATDRAAARGLRHRFTDWHRTRSHHTISSLCATAAGWNSQVASTSTPVYQHQRHYFS